MHSALCLATLLAEGVFLGLAWQRGWSAPDRIQRAKEAFYGIQRREIRTRLTSNKSPAGAQQSDQDFAQRAMRVTDLPLRSDISRCDSIEFGVERNSLQIDQSRYEQTRIGFDRALDADIQRLETAAIDSVQGLMEQLPPRGAKEHLMLMLTAPGDNDPKQSLDDVVKVMRRLAPDRRRKIFSEFQTPDESGASGGHAASDSRSRVANARRRSGFGANTPSSPTNAAGGPSP